MNETLTLLEWLPHSFHFNNSPIFVFDVPNFNSSHTSILEIDDANKTA